jgi:hypothetical protein
MNRPVTCGCCGSPAKKATAYWPVGPVCRACYRHARQNPGSCRLCGQLRVLIAESPDAAGTRVELSVCGPCSDSPHSYLCVECGGGEEPYQAHVCVRCSVRRMLTEQFAGPSGQLSPQARIVTEALAASRRPRSVMQWLSRPTGGAEILRIAYRSGEDVTHELLDKYHGRTVWSLRGPWWTSTSFRREWKPSPSLRPASPPSPRSCLRATGECC